MARTGWALAFLVFASASGALGAATWRKWRRPASAPQVPPRRDAKSIGDIELGIILAKIREGDLLAIQGDLAGARRAWDAALLRGAGVWQIHEGVADSFERVGLLAEAEREYATAESLAKFPGARQSIRFKRAGVIDASGRPDEAFEVLLEVDPPALGRMLAVYSKAKDKPRLGRLLRGRAETADARLWLLDSEVARIEGRHPDAARSLARYARVVEPWNRRLCLQAVQGLEAAGLHVEAIEVCRAWSRARPQDVEAFWWIGRLWLHLGDPRRAYLAYTSIVDVRPGDADAHRMLGQALRDLKRLDDAIRAFEKSKALRPEEPQRWIDLAETLSMKDPEAGRRLFDEIAKRQWDARFASVVDTIRRRQAEGLLRELEECRKRGDANRAREIRRHLAEYNVPEAAFALKVVVTWDTAVDLDLDVIDPAGEHVHHGAAASKSGGRYWVDDTSGHGPETFTHPNPPAGRYRIGAHLHAAVRTTAKFVVILHEDTDREQRFEHTLLFEKAGEQKFVPEIVVP